MNQKQVILKSIVFTVGLSVVLQACAHRAHAASRVESEFELVLPRQFQQSLIEQKWKSLVGKEFTANWRFPDQVVTATQGVQVHLNGLSLALKTQLQKPALTQGQSVLELQSQALQAQMVISRISVDQTVTQTVGGITGHFDIHAQCNNVVLNMRSGMGQFGITLKPSVGSGQAGADVQDVNLTWQAGAWVAQDFSCSGVDGFTDLVKQEVQKIADDANSFVAPRKMQMISLVQEYLAQNSFDFSKPRQLISARSDINISMVVDHFDESNPDRMLARGRLILDFSRAANKPNKTLSLNNEAPVYSAAGTQALIRLPGDFIKEVMAQAYSANSWVHQVPSSKLPGFSSVMGSRFVQFFIWPELMNYSKSSQFLFDIYSNKDPVISGTGLQYQVGMSLLSRMQAPKKSGYIPFMNFSIPFNSRVDLAVSGGKVSVGFKNTDLKLKYQWDSSYVQKYDPSTRFGSSTIQSRILSAIAGQTMNFSLPQIPLSEGVSLKVNKVQSLKNSDLLLQLAP